MQVDGLLLQRPPQPFNKDVVEVLAPTIHGYFDVSVGQSRDPSCTCVLAALVRIHYLWLAISGDCLLQRLNAKAGIQRIGKPPGQNLTGRPIHALRRSKAIAYRPKDCHQIQKAVLDGDVGNVAAPNLIGPRDCEFPQQVWINAVLWVLLAGIRPLVDGLQPHDIH